MATVEFFGETFGLTGDVSEFGLMEFAEAAADGQDGDTLQGLASIMRLLRECIVEHDVVDSEGEVVAHGWGRFKASARANRAKTEEHLMPVIQAAFQAQADRPTSRPSDSSDGPASIKLNSESTPDVSGTDRLAGRPDLQLQLVKARQTA